MNSSFSTSGTNERNKTGGVLPGEWTSVIMMELDHVTHNPPLLRGEKDDPVGNGRYYTDKSRVAKQLALKTDNWDNQAQRGKTVGWIHGFNPLHGGELGKDEPEPECLNLAGRCTMWFMIP